MTADPWEPTTRPRRGWLTVTIALALCLVALLWAGSGADPRNSLPWGWSADGWVIPARSLTYVWIACALLFAILSRVAWRLHHDWPPPRRLIRWHQAVLLMLVVIAVYTAIALAWIPLPLDPRLLTADTLPHGGLARLPGLLAGILTIAVLCAWLLQQKRSIWWAALVALHPLMLLQCASTGSHYCLATLALVLLPFALPRLPITAQKFAPLLPAALAILAVALTSRLDPFNSPTTLLPFTIAPIARILIELLLQSLLLPLAHRRRWPFAKNLGHQLLLAILLLPNIPPAVVLLPLVLIPFAWNRTTWALSLATLLAYTAIPTLRETGNFHVPTIIATLQWIPILVLLAEDLTLELLALRRPSPAGDVGTTPPLTPTDAPA